MLCSSRVDIYITLSVAGLNPAEERHVSIAFTASTVISHYSSRAIKTGAVCRRRTTGRVKFHLIKGIGPPLTRDVLLDDSRGGRAQE